MMEGELLVHSGKVSAGKISGRAGRAARPVPGERGFSMVELMVVMVLIVLILGITVVVWRNAARRTDLQAAVEIVKEDIRKTYALADAGVAVTGSDGIKRRDQYRIEFRDNGTIDQGKDPLNCYRIIKRTWNVGTNDWNAPTVVAPEKRASIRIINNEWIRPSLSSSTIITSYNNLTLGNASNKWNTNNYGITFESKGSIIQCDGTFTDKTITLRETSQNKNASITVTPYGNVE